MESNVNESELRAELEKLRAELETILASAQVNAKAAANGKKNHKEYVGDPARVYERVGDFVDKEAPAQQRAIAAIVAQLTPVVGDKVDEATLFAALVAAKSEDPTLSKSAQSATYLFKYYRGLGEGRGFTARGFLRG